MEAREVLVTIRLNQKHLQQIREVDPRLRVHYLVDETAQPDAPRAIISSPAPPEELARALQGTEILFTLRVSPDLLAQAPRLKWVHLSSHGIDHIQGSDILNSPVLVTCSRGAYAAPVAEHALWMMLSLVKEGPRLYRQQQEKKWERFPLGDMEGKTLGLVGLGSIAHRAAHLARALGMRVLATKRHHESWDPGLAPVDQVLPPSQLHRLLAESDFVLITVPLIPETRELIGEAQLRAMKPTAYLINVARGGVVDEVALVRALKEGWIAGAGLDVFQREPLPPESELWALPNVISSPHIAGVTPRLWDRATEAFCQNLRRYLAGEELLNRVDREKGY